MAAFSTLQDAFHNTTLNGTLWSPYTAGSATLGYSSVGATCTFPSASTSATDGDVASQNSYTLANSAVYVRVLAVPSAATNADATLSLRDSGYTNIIAMQVEAGILYAQKVVSGVQTNLASITYNATSMLYWRIREASGTVYWEYSADGLTYTTLYSAADPITITALYADIGGSCYENETNPGTFRWDNFNTMATVKTNFQQGISRIANNKTKTQSAISRIAVNKTKTQGAVAKIYQGKANYQTGIARIKQTLVNTITSISRIAMTVTKTQTSHAYIVQQKYHTQTATARIQSTPKHLPKRYVYKSFSLGTYLGNIPGVTSPFAFSQEINTAGATCQIVAAISPDTNLLPSADYTDESGNLYEDESGNIYTTEGAVPIFSPGNSLTGALIKDGNIIQVWEYSEYWPNGKCMFIGQVQRVEANYGSGSGADTVTMLVYSDGQDLSNYVVRANPYTYTADQSQVTSGAIAVVEYVNAPTDSFQFYGQTFETGSGVTNVGQIALSLSSSGSYAAGAGAVPVTINFYDGEATLNLLGSVTQSVNVTSATTTYFDFPFSIPVTASTTYFFTVSVPQGYYIGLAYITGSPYANGSMYNNIYSGSGAASSWAITSGSDLYFETYSGTGATVGMFTGLDPSTGIVVAIMEDYQARGGLIKFTNGTSVVATGLSINYQFNTNTTYEGIQAMQTIATSGFYFYVDLGTDILYFQPTHSMADIVLTKGRHIQNLNMVFSIENIKNQAYFVGGIPSGDTQNIYVLYGDATSLALYGPKLDRLSDTNVLDVPTATIFATEDVNGNKAEQNQTTVDVLAETMDITLFKPGMVVSFNGFGTFIESLLLQIVRIDYTPDVVTLTLGVMPKRMSLTLQQIAKGLLAQETIANPDTPS